MDASFRQTIRVKFTNFSAELVRLLCSKCPTSLQKFFDFSMVLKNRTSFCGKMWWFSWQDSNRPKDYILVPTHYILYSAQETPKNKSVASSWWGDWLFLWKEQKKKVGVTRLERATTWSQTRCATNCATPRLFLAVCLKHCKGKSFFWFTQAKCKIFLEEWCIFVIV